VAVFYIERTDTEYLPGGREQEWPTIVAQFASFDVAFEHAVQYLNDHWQTEDVSRVAILVGDDDGPHETAARVELRARGMELVIEAPIAVPAAILHQIGARIPVGTHGDDVMVQISLARGAKVPEEAIEDASSRRFRMMEFGRGYGKAESDDEEEDPSRRRFGLLEFNPGKDFVGTRARVGDPAHPGHRGGRIGVVIKDRDGGRWLVRFDDDGTEEWIDAKSQVMGIIAGNPCTCRKNPSPEEHAAAVDKYKEFHRYDPHRIVEIELAIPRRVRELGPAAHVLYRSGKVDPETLKKPKRAVDYIHEHDDGVVAYACDGAADTDVPEDFTSVGAVVVLGKCLGFAMKDGTEAEGTHPLPDLCCTPDGTCLLVVQGKKKVLAMMWGGALGVFARGIDG
jgi:hypothetical protein